MAISSAAYGSQTATISTEHSLTTQTSITGVYVLLVDCSNMQSGDTVELRIKTKRHSGDSSVLACLDTYSGAQTVPQKYSVPVPVDTEITCTLTQTAGTGRSFPWKLLRA